jgi:hypothetical protein
LLTLFRAGLKEKIAASQAPELSVKFTHDPHSSGIGKLIPQVSLRVAQVWTDIMGNVLVRLSHFKQFPARMLTNEWSRAETSGVVQRQLFD